jgi:uncharacterized protein YkwD
MKNPVFKANPALPVRAVAIWLNLALLGPGLIGAGAIAAQAETYAQTAQNLVRNLPADARFREDLEAQLAKEANRFRGSKDVGGLKASTKMRLAARAQAVDMMKGNFVGHRATTGQDFESRMRSFVGSVDPFSMPRMAENAARDTQKGEANAVKASRLFQQWVDSRPHRKTLLNATYTNVSTGVVQRGNKIWAVQIFWNHLPEKQQSSSEEDGVY